jgi:hypothetical protein
MQIPCVYFVLSGVCVHVCMCMCAYRDAEPGTLYVCYIVSVYASNYSILCVDFFCNWLGPAADFHHVCVCMEDFDYPIFFCVDCFSICVHVRMIPPIAFCV